MLADYRCNEIKNLILQENEPLIKEFLNLATLNDIGDFKEKVVNLTDKILKEYDLSAANYLDERYKHYRNELYLTLSEKFHIAFVNQTKRLIPISQKYFRNDFEKELKESKIFYHNNF